MMARDLGPLLDRLSRSAFRGSFRLGEKEKSYLEVRGVEVIRSHAADFVGQRLATAQPGNDGRQIPMRGHPVFIAQHAAATCCRTCLAKWHGIPVGRALSEDEQAYVVDVLMEWVRRKPERVRR